MHRRDFMVGAALTPALLALGPSTRNLPDAGLWPYQEWVRRHIAETGGARLLWGQASGKSHLFGAACVDRIMSLGHHPVSVAMVCQSSTVAAHFQRGVERHAALRNIQTELRFYLYSHRRFMAADLTTETDIVFLDEVDWAEGYTASNLISKAEDVAPFVYACSSPSSLDSSYMNYFKGSKANHAFYDHATTWEVNPFITREHTQFCVRDDAMSFSRWQRDFAAYKE